MFSRPKILFLVSLLFVALLNPKFNPYLLFKFFIENKDIIIVAMYLVTIVMMYISTIIYICIMYKHNYVILYSTYVTHVYNATIVYTSFIL